MTAKKAKRKNSGKRVTDPVVVAHKRSIQMALDSELHLWVECAVCGERYERSYDDLEYDNAEIQFADEMYNDGWRRAVCGEYAVIGMTCPTCLRRKDTVKYID